MVHLFTLRFYCYVKFKSTALGNDMTTVPPPKELQAFVIGPMVGAVEQQAAGSQAPAPASLTDRLAQTVNCARHSGIGCTCLAGSGRFSVGTRRKLVLASQLC